jgi:tetratricopeptide (TPR) repeat protein
MELSQRNPIAYAGRAYAHYAFKSYGHAYLDATKALTLDPGNAEAYLCRALVHRALDDLPKTVSDFHEVLKRAKSSHLKIYAVLQLLDLSAGNEYIPAEKIDMIPLSYELVQKNIKTAEELCVLVMALGITGEFELAKKACRELLHTFLPDALPYHLQKDFIMLLLNPVYWMTPDCGLFTKEFARLFKTQIISMILNMDDREVLLNAGIQALCPQTALGGMLYIKRGHVQPSLASGSLHKLGAELDYLIMSRSPRNRNVRLDAATQTALRQEITHNPAFKNALGYHFPHLYRFLEKHLVMQAAQHTSLFYFRNGPTSVQQLMPAEEEGNRFIQDL